MGNRGTIRGLGAPRARRSSHQNAGPKRSLFQLDRPSTKGARHAVVNLVLALHPDDHLTIPDLVRSLLGASEPAGAELECAVRDLVSEGLLSIKRSRLWPTSAVLGSLRSDP